MKCNCPNGSYGQKHTDDCNARARQAQERYELVRSLSPRQFSALWERAINGERFDEAVDTVIAARVPLEASPTTGDSHVGD